jgi:hypothetical protein
LWTILSVNKEIFKNLLQYQGWVTCVLVPLILIDLFVLLIQFNTQTIVHNLCPIYLIPLLCSHRCDGIFFTKVIHLFFLIDHIYNCKVFHWTWQPQTLHIPFIFCKICGCNFTTL